MLSEPGKVRDVATRYGVSQGTYHYWRRKAQEGNAPVSSHEAGGWQPGLTGRPDHTPDAVGNGATGETDTP